MLALMAKNWWLFLVRGIAAIVFGILAFAWPGITLLTMVFFFGAFALIDGISAIFAAVRGDPGTRGHGWTVAILGVISVIAGIVAFFYPGHHRARAAVPDCGLGAGCRRLRDLLGLPAAHGDHERVVDGPGRRRIDRLRDPARSSSRAPGSCRCSSCSRRSRSSSASRRSSWRSAPRHARPRRPDADGDLAGLIAPPELGFGAPPAGVARPASSHRVARAAPAGAQFSFRAWW